MGKARAAFSKNVGEQYSESVIKYTVGMSDQVFDQWLVMVVSKRAANGSNRAQAMLDLAQSTQTADDNA